MRGETLFDKSVSPRVLFYNRSLLECGGSDHLMISTFRLRNCVLYFSLFLSYLLFRIIIGAIYSTFAQNLPYSPLPLLLIPLNFSAEFHPVFFGFAGTGVMMPTAGKMDTDFCFFHPASV